MNKNELLEKIREKNEELDSLNKELKEIIAEENAKMRNIVYHFFQL